MAKKHIWAIVVLVGLGALYFLFNPGYYSIFPKCPVLTLTGLKCPGCGSQRAIHHLLHFDIPGAFGQNALLVLSLPIIAILLYAEAVRKSRPGFYMKLHNTTFMWGYVVVAISWCIYRNIFNV